MVTFAFLGLVSVRILRDYYFSAWKSNGRYVFFAVMNLAAGYYYMDVYELACMKIDRCPGDVSGGKTWIAFFLTMTHISAAIGALDSRR